MYIDNNTCLFVVQPFMLVFLMYGVIGRSKGGFSHSQFPRAWHGTCFWLAGVILGWIHSQDSSPLTSGLAGFPWFTRHCSPPTSQKICIYHDEV